MECPICKNTIEPLRNVVTSCNHQFCTECFFKWIKEGKSCPLCRKIFIKNETEEKRQELMAINHQIDIDYDIMNSLYSKNRQLERQIYHKKAELNIYKEKLQKLQRHIDYKRDWLDLYNIKIQSHNIKIRSQKRMKRNWMQHH